MLQDRTHDYVHNPYPEYKSQECEGVIAVKEDILKVHSSIYRCRKYADKNYISFEIL